ncbi:hypothetical protein [Panacagrimonas perspica]|nr:hypothetical protein [Panacagrimonas perspica]
MPDDDRIGHKLLALPMEYGVDPKRRVPSHRRTLLEDAEALAAAKRSKR